MPGSSDRSYPRCEIFMETLRVDRFFHRASPCRSPLRRPSHNKEMQMEDLMWLGFIVGLLAVTLVYVRLCDNA